MYLIGNLKLCTALLMARNPLVALKWFCCISGIAYSRPNDIPKLQHRGGVCTPIVGLSCINLHMYNQSLKRLDLISKYSHALVATDSISMNTMTPIKKIGEYQCFCSNKVKRLLWYSHLKMFIVGSRMESYQI